LGSTSATVRIGRRAPAVLAADASSAIASTVIGGANLLGGEGGAYAAFIGAALIEVIRNSLLLAGVNPYWQGTFVGLFIILAVLLERLRGRKVDS